MDKNRTGNFTPYLISFKDIIPTRNITTEKSLNSRGKVTLKQYKKGTIIFHQNYGKGIIISKPTINNIYEVQFSDGIHYIGQEHISRRPIPQSYDDERKQYEVNDTSTIESGDLVYNRIYGHGLVIRKFGDEDLFDCKFGKIRIYLKSEYLTKEDSVTSNNSYRTSPVQAKKPAIRNIGISHNLTKTNTTRATNNEIGVVKHSKYALTGNASNPANRQNTNDNIPKHSSEKTTSKSSQKRIMVKFPNGTIICNDDIEETYIDALWEFDPDSIILNRICFNGISIITSENTKDGRVQVGVNQWAYVPSQTMNIIKVLENISKALNIEMEIHEF